MPWNKWPESIGMGGRNDWNAHLQPHPRQVDILLDNGMPVTCKMVDPNACTYVRNELASAAPLISQIVRDKTGSSAPHRSVSLAAGMDRLQCVGGPLE